MQYWDRGRPRPQRDAVAPVGSLRSFADEDVRGPRETLSLFTRGVTKGRQQLCALRRPGPQRDAVAQIYSLRSFADEDVRGPRETLSLFTRGVTKG
jgi:hypothetical protein